MVKYDNPIDIHRHSLLHIAVLIGSRDFVAHLLDTGVYVNATNFYGQTPLCYAVKADYIQDDIINLLLHAGADPSICDAFGENVSHEIAQRPWLKQVNTDHQVNFNITLNGEGFTLLHHAAITRDANLAAWLLAAGADANVVNVYGETPLLQAMIGPVVDALLVRHLLEYGADVTLCDFLGRAPINWICSRIYQDSDSVEFTIAVDALRNAQSISPFSTLFQYNDAAFIRRLLVSAQLVLDRVYDDGHTILHCLALNCNQGVADVLREYRFQVDVRNSLDQTPLMVASTCNNVDIMRLLLERGALVDAVDVEGYSALFHIVCALHWDEAEAEPAMEAAVALVINVGANLQLIDHSNLNVFERCWLMNRQKLCRTLIAHLCMQECAGTVIVDNVQNFLLNDAELSLYLQLCRLHLSTVLASHQVNLYTLLTCSMRKCCSIVLENGSNTQMITHRTGIRLFDEIYQPKISHARQLVRYRNLAQLVIDSRIFHFKCGEQSVVAKEISSYLTLDDCQQFIERL